ncbi:MAG: AgmX/PglI C-terminal domain-containing protein [Nannocystaceae bacterium]|nr:AgmX/PglI C-terminal domain-containing protein [Nannocystaceae bacterium]
MSSSWKNFALPLVALAVLAGWFLWNRSQPAAPPAAPQPAGKAPGKAAPELGREGARPGSATPPATSADAAARPAEKPSDPPRATVRDRARSDALRLALQQRRGSTGGGGSKTAGETVDEAATGTLDKDYIRARIQEDLVPLAQECYESALEDDAALAGKLTMHFDIVGDADVGGVVDGAQVDPGSEIKHPALLECMRESMMSLSFAPPEGGGTVSVTYPFVFAAGDDAGKAP